MRAAALAIALLALGACAEREEPPAEDGAALPPDGAPVAATIGPDAEPAPAAPQPDTTPATGGTPGTAPLAPDGSVDPEALGEPYQDYVGETP